MNERNKVLELFEQKKDFMSGKIENGIDNYRKGYAGISLKNKEGNTLSDVKIHVNQKSHYFKFGANLLMLDGLETPEKNDAYKMYLADVFNMATLPFYWDATEPQKGALRYAKNSEKIYRRPPIDLCMEFCDKHGIEPREHALAYEHFFPDWLSDASVCEIKEALEKRYMEIAERYKDKIRTIEVTNEMRWKNGKTCFYNEPDYIEWCFKTAEKYFPSNQLGINEGFQIWSENGRVTDYYYSYIEAALLKGVRIDAIGMQYHMFFNYENEYSATRPYYDPERLYKFMDLYSNFKKPLQITEVTVPAYSNDSEDEEIQAEIIENLYSIWFSHPNVEQIIYWNLVDGYAHLWDSDPEKIRASLGDMSIGENYYYGGLLRFDLTPKPAYNTIKNLIQKKWHTETDIVTGDNGSAKFKGFYGKYDIDIFEGGKKITKEINLTPNVKKEFVIEV